MGAVTARTTPKGLVLIHIPSILETNLFMSLFRFPLAFSMCVFILSSCYSTEKHKEEFISRFSQDDFKPFRGLTLFTRGNDRDGNTLIVLADARLNAICTVPSPLTFISVNKSTNQIKSISTNFTDSCKAVLSAVQTRELVNSFVKYGIRFLHVDLDDDVFIGLGGESMETDLLRTEHLNELDSYLRDEFVPLNGKWHERRLP